MTRTELISTPLCFPELCQRVFPLHPNRQLSPVAYGVPSPVRSKPCSSPCKKHKSLIPKLHPLLDSQDALWGLIAAFTRSFDCHKPTLTVLAVKEFKTSKSAPLDPTSRSRYTSIPRWWGRSHDHGSSGGGALSCWCCQRGWQLGLTRLGHSAQLIQCWVEDIGLFKPCQK